GVRRLHAQAHSGRQHRQQEVA
ncbi:MAG: hypothetical protein RLZZ95_576, partial [Pseudomonadota bacterium]